ncbi:hypothetical protein NKR23_g7734 [Pleurostoma richardsiae]|uniref:Uncharacterized protein n=1 Tax=Pleurostoma richardsiae TaxID=41990 RepID=A0AA38RVH0_9PEZI|nr:hypothetical protein NKR23_g7734 [Pleurostoma richardsiae]
MNGMNGGQLPPMINMPTPAGHQAELNYIYSLVEDLSRQLAENKRVLEEVVTGVGRVRNRARAHSLGNNELIASASEDIRSQEPNIDSIVSMLSEALEKARYSQQANATLLTQYATVIAAMLKQFHEYKAKHVADVAAWHRSYRAQLAEARAENSRLREQIWEMQEHAGRANENLRRFRAKYDEDAARWERRVDARAVRQELRFWKRMAMPEIPDDDEFWSDDDDIVDCAEKMRLLEMERKAQEQLAAGGAGGIGEQGGSGEEEDELAAMQQGNVPVSMMGGIPMQRENSSGIGMPEPPPRPSSAASTGSSGQ